VVILPGFRFSFFMVAREWQQRRVIGHFLIRSFIGLYYLTNGVVEKALPVAV